MPLRTLNDVPWQELHHAYGPATDLPDKLQSLLSEDPDERAWAIDQLEMGCVHQGSLYPATPKIIPVLFELLSLPKVEGKPEILGLIRHGMLGHEEAEGLLDEIRHHVSGGLPVLTDLARDPDPEVRAATCLVLGTLNRSPGEAMPILRTMLATEQDGPVRANIWLAVFDLWKHTLAAGQDTQLLESLTPLARQDMQEGPEAQRHTAALVTLVGGEGIDEALAVMLATQQAQKELVDQGWFDLPDDLQGVLKKRPDVRRQWMHTTMRSEDRGVRHRTFLAIQHMVFSERSALIEGTRLLQDMLAAEGSPFLHGLISEALALLTEQVQELTQPEWRETPADRRFAERAAEQLALLRGIEEAWRREQDGPALQRRCLGFVEEALRVGHVPAPVMQHLHGLLDRAGQLGEFAPQLRALYDTTDWWDKGSLRPVVCLFCGLDDVLTRELSEQLEHEMYPGEGITAIELLGVRAHPLRPVIERVLQSDDRMTTRGWPNGREDSITEDEKYRGRLQEVLKQLQA